MEYYVIELSKYVISITMILYVLLGFSTYITKDKNRHQLLFGMQDICIFFFVFLCFIDLTFVSSDVRYLYLFCFIMAFLLLAMFLVTYIYDEINRILLNNMCMLISIGLCVISRLSFAKAVRQYIILLGGLAIGLVLPWFFQKVRWLKKITYLYAAIGIGMLSIVLLFSKLTNGSKITYSIGGITFQPSEFVKILFLFFLAAALWEKTDIWRIGFTALIAGIHVVILVISKDLGSALIFFIAYVLIVVMMSGNYLYLLCGVFGGALAGIVAYKIFSHVRVRVLAWRDPWTYIDKQGYQITQSLFAISNGGLWGVGLMQGDPDDIPFAVADFIFSAICEEFGIIFGLCLLLICIHSFLEMMFIAMKIRDRFYQAIVYGIGITYLFQIFLTVGGGSKFIPLTGVTLPFVSYGGSSILTTMIMFFVVQAIYIRLQQMQNVSVRNHEKR